MHDALTASEPLRFGPMEWGAASIAVAIILTVAWYRYFRGARG